jgi:hypothetical protein
LFFWVSLVFDWWVVVLLNFVNLWQSRYILNLLFYLWIMTRHNIMKRIATSGYSLTRCNRSYFLSNCRIQKRQKKINSFVLWEGEAITTPRYRIQIGNFTFMKSLFRARNSWLCFSHSTYSIDDTRWFFFSVTFLWILSKLKDTESKIL